jgi:hypothetical protein
MKRLCLIHANCQGEPLVDLLGAHPDFSRDFETRHYVNYTRQPVPAEDLARCGLFLYQRLEAHWGGLASDVLLAALPPGTPGCACPTCSSRGIGPFGDPAG